MPSSIEVRRAALDALIGKPAPEFSRGPSG